MPNCIKFLSLRNRVEFLIRTIILITNVELRINPFRISNYELFQLFIAERLQGFIHAIEQSSRKYLMLMKQVKISCTEFGIRN